LVTFSIQGKRKEGHPPERQQKFEHLRALIAIVKKSEIDFGKEERVVSGGTNKDDKLQVEFEV